MPFVSAGNFIWLDRGPAHFNCWVEEVRRVPVRKQPFVFDPKLIYAESYDAMTMTRLHPWQLINRMNKRQFFTYFADGRTRGPDTSK